MGRTKIRGVKPHKAPPIVRWIGAFGNKVDSPLREQFRYEFLESFGKSAEALKRQHKSNPRVWYSYLASVTGLGLLVDISATPLHRCYVGDAHTDRGYENDIGIPLLYDPDKTISYVTKYSQIWNGISSKSTNSWDEVVVGNGKNPIRYRAIVYRKDCLVEAEFFASITGLPAYELVGEAGSVDLEPLGFKISDYYGSDY